MTEDETFKNYAKECTNCRRQTFLPYGWERTCNSCGYNVTKQKFELTRKQRIENKLCLSPKIC